MKKYLTLADRTIIEWELNRGTSLRKIALLLGRPKSTIIYEVKTKSYRGKYMATKAELDIKENMSSRGAKSKMTMHWDLLIFLEDNYDPKFNSLDVCLKAWKKNYPDAPSLATLYNWIPKGALGQKTLLRPREYKKTIRLWKKMLGRPITLRETEQNMNEIGHWEGDFVVGGLKKEKGYILTLVEKKTRFAITQFFASKHPEEVLILMKQLLVHFNENIFKSITFDNGIEFSYLPQLEEEFKTKIYYAFPYSSWQRGQNENWNGVFRRAFPKGTDFTQVSISEINYYTDVINNMPRKILDYRSPRELFNEFLEANNYKIIYN